MMSAAATASGGGVAAGGTVATLQSIGAVGLTAGATVGVAAVGAASGATAILGAVILGKKFSKNCVYDPFPDHPKKIALRDGITLNTWLVVTEEGRGNVRCYAFDTEVEARAFFDGASRFLARLLLDPTTTEVASAGWNSRSNDTLRKCVRKE